MVLPTFPSFVLIVDDQCVDVGRLPRPGNDDRAARVGLQVGLESLEERLRRCRCRRRSDGIVSTPSAAANCLDKAPRSRWAAAARRWSAQAPVMRGNRLDHVEPVHLAARLRASRRPAAKSRAYLIAIGSPPPNRSASSATITLACGQFQHAAHAADRTPRRRSVADDCRPTAARTRTTPTLGKAFWNRSRMSARLGELRRLAQDANPAAVALEHAPSPSGRTPPNSTRCACRRRCGGSRRGCGRGRRAPGSLAWAIASAGAAVQRMARVALDLDRPAVVAGDQQALGHAADLHRRGVADRHAGRAAGRPMGVGGQLLLRHADAAAQRRPTPATPPSAAGTRGGRSRHCLRRGQSQFRGDVVADGSRRPAQKSPPTVPGLVGVHR